MARLRNTKQRKRPAPGVHRVARTSTARSSALEREHAAWAVVGEREEGPAMSEMPLTPVSDFRSGSAASERRERSEHGARFWG